MAGRVELILDVQGTGNAASKISETQRALAGLETASTRASAAQKAANDAQGEAATAAREKMQRTGAAFAGVTAILGAEAVPAVQKFGQSMTAAGAAANIIPGPIGLIVAGVAGAAVAAWTFAKNLEAARQQAAIIGEAEFARLTQTMGLAGDEAAKIGVAMRDAGERGFKPAHAEIQRAIEAGKRLGLDPVAAAKLYADALGGTKEQAKALRDQLGLTATAQKTDADLLYRAGVNSKVLTQDKLTAEQEFRKALDAQRDRLQKIEALQTSVAAAETVIADKRAKSADKVIAYQDIEAAREKLGVLVAQREAGDKLIQTSGAALEKERLTTAQKEAQEAATARESAVAAVYYAKAEGARSKRDAADLTQKGIQIEINAVLDEQDAIRQRLLGTADGTKERAAGELEMLKAQARLEALQARDRAVRRAAAQAGAAAAKQRADAVASAERAEIELLKAQGVSADKLYELTLRQIAVEERAASRGSKPGSPKARAAEAKADKDRLEATRANITAEIEARGQVIEAEQRFADRRRAVDARRRADAIAVAEAEGDIHGAARLRALDAEQQRLDAVAAAGDKYNATIRAIPQWLSEEEKARREKIALLEREGAVLDANAQKEARAREDSRKSADQLKANAKEAFQTLQASASVMSKGGPLAQGLGAVSAGAAKLAADWDKVKSNTAGVIAGVGDVASAVIQNERAKQAVQAISYLAAGIVAAVTPGAQAQAAAYFGAAALLGASAAGVIGSSGAGASTGGGTSGTAATGGQAKGGATIYNFNGFVVANPQQVARSIERTQRTLAKTGYSKHKGA